MLLLSSLSVLVLPPMDLSPVPATPRKPRSVATSGPQTPHDERITMTEQQALPSQTPQRSDYQRAAALMLHQFRRDTEGFNSVMAEADQLGRLSSLVLAIVEMAGQAADPLASPKGLAGLQAVAAGMAIDDADAQ
jgi:hypothetical protein